jgi:hypothetical protein
MNLQIILLMPQQNVPEFIKTFLDLVDLSTRCAITMPPSTRNSKLVVLEPQTEANAEAVLGAFRKTDGSLTLWLPYCQSEIDPL